MPVENDVMFGQKRYELKFEYKKVTMSKGRHIKQVSKVDLKKGTLVTGMTDSMTVTQVYLKTQLCITVMDQKYTYICIYIYSGLTISQHPMTQQVGLTPSFLSDLFFSHTFSIPIETPLVSVAA